MVFNLSKKGELTTKQLVTIIILIASFIVILLLIFRLNLGQTTDKEICRNSVVLAGKTPLSGSLDCRTSYVTISGESKNETMQSIANEMADCWYMFGEGKSDYAGSWTETEVKYAICSIVEFDEKIQEEFPEITYAEFYQYLATTQNKDSGNYLRYIYGVSNVASLQIEPQFNISISQDKIKTSEKYSIITGVDKNIFEPFDDDEILRVYLIPTSETGSRLYKDRSFITKA